MAANTAAAAGLVGDWVEGLRCSYVSRTGVHMRGCLVKNVAAPGGGFDLLLVEVPRSLTHAFGCPVYVQVSQLWNRNQAVIIVDRHGATVPYAVIAKS